MGALVREVVLDEAILTVCPSAAVAHRLFMDAAGNDSPSAVPEIEHQVAHELDVAVLHVNRRAQPPHVLCDIVAEDNGAHRRLARAALAHEQHLALLLSLARVHRGSRCCSSRIRRGFRVSLDSRRFLEEFRWSLKVTLATREELELEPRRGLGVELPSPNPSARSFLGRRTGTERASGRTHP